MKVFLAPAALILVALAGSVFAADLPVATTAAAPEYQALLTTYATTSGVRYAAWKKNEGDLAALEKVTEFHASTLPPADRDTALAWHLNAYNAWILRRILERYPVKGPLAAHPQFFKATGIVVSGKNTNFDEFEQKVIRPKFREPRVHFALNCASSSCPPLDKRPLEGKGLDAQLDRLTRAYVTANPLGVAAKGKSVSLSRIFEWYAEDFAAAGGAVTFINHYRTEPLPAGAKVKFLDYDWTLNEAR